MSEPDAWPNVCVLCAHHGRQTRLKWGHCCARCADRLASDVRAISDLACMAAASIAPGSGTGVAGPTVAGSRPPVTVDALDPELALIGPPPSPTVLDVVEAWERMIRDYRGMAPYGPASAHRAAVAARTGAGGSVGTRATLVGVVGFLAGQSEWVTSEPGFPLEDYADEVRACVRVLRRWDTEAEHPGTMVKCPTLTDDGECNYRLHYRDLEDEITCRRCGATRSAMTLAAVAMADGREVWLDPEAAASYLGVSESTLKRMARRGEIDRAHGRYLVRHRVEEIA